MASGNGIVKDGDTKEVDLPIPRGYEFVPPHIRRENMFTEVGVGFGSERLGVRDFGMVDVEGPEIEHALPRTKDYVPPHLRLENMAAIALGGNRIAEKCAVKVDMGKQNGNSGTKPWDGVGADLVSPGMQHRNEPEQEPQTSLISQQFASHSFTQNEIAEASKESLLEENVTPCLGMLVDLNGNDQKPVNGSTAIKSTEPFTSNIALLSGLIFDLNPIANSLSGLNLNASQDHSLGGEARDELMGLDLPSPNKGQIAESEEKDDRPYSRDLWWGPDENAEWNPEYNWHKPDPFHKQFSPFPDFL